MRPMVKILTFLFSVSAVSIGMAGYARNIILCVGDGMGHEQIKAARYYAGAPLVFESFPHQSNMTVASLSALATDSAASATAMATGVKVHNEVVSVRLPGDGAALETVLEIFQARGKSVGLVTTDAMTKATPAAFGAHAADRDLRADIASDFLNDSRPNVLFGGGEPYLTPATAAAAGYLVATNRAQLLAIDTDTTNRVAGLFGDDSLPFHTVGLGELPDLHEMVPIALDLLDNDPDGFFLLIEEERIDSACHDYDIENATLAALEFSAGVEQALAWMGSREDTLLIVLGDHETSGLIVTADNGPGNLASVNWTSTYHTDVPVGVFSIGLNAPLVTHVADNTDIYAFMLSPAVVPEILMEYTINSNGVKLVWTASAGDAYELVGTPQLSNPTWDVAGNVTAISERITFDLPLGASNLFYRLNSLGTP